jgi:hypothetical protein
MRKLAIVGIVLSGVLMSAAIAQAKPVGMSKLMASTLKAMLLAERAARTDEEFAQVIACDVLDHFATSFDQAPVRKNNFEADEIVTNRPVTAASGSVLIQTQQRLDREPFGMGRIDWQPLAAPGQATL